LREHLGGVAAWARGFSDRCGLPESIARSVERAAAWHDAGKVDPRFQRLLRGGSDARSVVDEPIAKSRIVLADRAARRRATERSGYPQGTRHELASVALLSTSTHLLGPEVDVDLVLHLVASHHGHCRPFAPVPQGDEAEPVDLVFATEGHEVRARSDHGLERLDSGVAERFWGLVERYGWFGLAWLEAIVRLADHRRSEEEQQEKTKGDGGVEVRS
jgi:CRISPR-associated endonuclease/helicase Cas3